MPEVIDDAGYLTEEERGWAQLVQGKVPASCSPSRRNDRLEVGITRQKRRRCKGGWGRKGRGYGGIFHYPGGGGRGGGGGHGGWMGEETMSRPVNAVSL